MTSALRWGWVVSSTLRPLYPPGKTRYPLYGRLGRPQGRSGRVRKISPPPGFDTRTVQPVASRYTDCAIPAPIKNLHVIFVLMCKEKVVLSGIQMKHGTEKGGFLDDHIKNFNIFKMFKTKLHTSDYYN